jgi:hypothetical protein
MASIFIREGEVWLSDYGGEISLTSHLREIVTQALTQAIIKADLETSFIEELRKITGPQHKGQQG